MEFLDVINDQGEKTGEVVTRICAHTHGILHRVIHVWVINDRHELLIQRRSATKEWAPNKLYVSMGCHIISGEDNNQAIIREMDEELGIDARPLMEKLNHIYAFRERCEMDDMVEDEIYDVYVLRFDVDKDALNLQDEEVASVQWMAYPTFREMILAHDTEFVDHGDNYLPLIEYLDGAIDM